MSNYNTPLLILYLNRFGGSDDDTATAVALDSSSNVYLTGTSESSSLTMGSQSLGNRGYKDFYVAKLSSSSGTSYLSIEFRSQG